VLNLLALLLLYLLVGQKNDYDAEILNLSEASAGQLTLYQMLDERIRDLEGRGQLEHLPNKYPHWLKDYPSGL
jgi:hypothetical protein